MGTIKNIEFYRTPGGEVMLKEAGKPVEMYELRRRDITRDMFTHIMEFYPKAFKALAEAYSSGFAFNRDVFEFKCVHRFIRCNFGEYDRIEDIDNLGNFSFEDVKCPMAGECKYHRIICNPEFETSLTDRELEVMKLYFYRNRPENIADKLCISIETVKTHKRNALTKLRMHSMEDFMVYAASNKIFDKGGRRGLRD